MDSTGISLQKFQMNTALSEISAQIKAGNGIFTQNSQTPVEVRLQAKLAIGDIIRVLPEYDNYTRGLLLSTGFLSNISMNGKLGDLNLEKADISLPGTFVCQATGNVQNLHIADRINGSLQWELRLKNSPVFANVMPDSLSKKIHIPPTRFTGNARLSPEMIRSKAQIESGDGLITLLARLNTKKEQYDGRILIDRFPLSSFLPHDSLGVLSASTRFSGEKYNPMDSSMYATVDLKIDSEEYTG